MAKRTSSWREMLSWINRLNIYECFQKPNKINGFGRKDKIIKTTNLHKNDDRTEKLFKFFKISNDLRW